MECTFIKGKFGGDMLYVPSERMLYVFDAERDDGSRIFRCYQKVLSDPKKSDCLSHTKCNSCVRLLQNGKCERMNDYIPHTEHPDHGTIVSDKQKLANMKAHCSYLRENHLEDAHKIPNQHIFQREISKSGRQNTNLTYKQVKRTLERSKNPVYPPIPSTFQGIKDAFQKTENMNKYGYTHDGDAKFYENTITNKDYTFVVFASKFAMSFIQNYAGTRKYLMDGTFDSLPKGFYQMLVITFEYENDIFPVAYVLMTRKTAKSYRAVFEYIEKHLFKFEPDAFMTDYEDGLRLAISQHWPGVPIHGCWFHFKRAVNRKCVSFGLKKFLQRNSYAMTLKSMLVDLPLLPEDKILEGYASIKAFANSKKLNAPFANVFSYFENYWLNQNERNTISVADLNMRTTSSVESMNSVIQRSFPTHPHIFKFAENLRLHEAIKSTDLFRLSLKTAKSEETQRKRPEDKKRDEKIRTNSEKLQNGVISAAEFLKLMAPVPKKPVPKVQTTKSSLHKVSSKSKTLKKRGKVAHPLNRQTAKPPNRPTV